MPQSADLHGAEPSRIGVLIVNLGSPEAPTPRAVRAYLKEFLSDRRVVEIPPILWQPILHAAILTTRPARTSRAYRQIWTNEGAPLAVITRQQADVLQQRLGESVIVDWAMRYGKPSIGERLDALRKAGCDRILLAPLYPQYSGATTASAIDAMGTALAGMRWQPAIRTLPPYYDSPAHIDALKTSVEQSLAQLPFQPDCLIASFHSMPARTLALGDPYHDQCRETARLLSEALGRPLVVTFQSRLGRAKWLEPATADTLAGLPATGTRRTAIFAPGFAADNLETLEELAIRGRRTFLDAGGTDFAYLPCLNGSPAGMDMLENLLSRQLAGWRSAP